MRINYLMLFLIALLHILIALLHIGCVRDIGGIPDTNIDKEPTYFWRGGEKLVIYPTENCYKIYRTKSEEERKQREIDYKTLECLDVNPLTYGILTTPELAATLSAMDEEIYSIPTYKTKEGEDVMFSERVIISLESEDDYYKLEPIAAKYNIKFVSKSYVRYWYNFTCTSETKGTSLEIANEIYEMGLFKNVFAGPILTIVPFSSDPLYNQQWGLNNTGQTVSTQTQQYTATPNIDIGYDSVKHLIPSNSDIKVAVIDIGVESHSDLDIHSSWDAFTKMPIKTIHGDAIRETHHGTRCAGIIGAKRNNIGITGIAPVKIMGISVKFDTTTTNIYDDLNSAFIYAMDNGADVISCSWGNDSPSVLIGLEDQIETVLTDGRDGKGCVVVFAAGNLGLPSVAYPANYDPRILCVGAITPNGERATLANSSFGSNYGSALDVMAPGVGILSTNASNMYDDFTGTSAACPFVSGTAAALLAIDPTLTREEVCDAIENSARKIGTGYNMQVTRPNGTWSQEYGYGLVQIDDAISYIFPDEVESNKIISSSCAYRGGSATFENVDIEQSAEVDIKSVFGNVLLTNVRQLNNSKLNINSRTNVVLSTLSLSDTSSLMTNCEQTATVNNLYLAENTKAEIVATDIVLNPGFELVEGSELTLMLN